MAKTIPPRRRVAHEVEGARGPVSIPVTLRNVIGHLAHQARAGGITPAMLGNCLGATQQHLNHVLRARSRLLRYS